MEEDEMNPDRINTTAVQGSDLADVKAKAVAKADEIETRGDRWIRTEVAEDRQSPGRYVAYIDWTVGKAAA